MEQNPKSFEKNETKKLFWGKKRKRMETKNERSVAQNDIVDIGTQEIIVENGSKFCYLSRSYADYCKKIKMSFGPPMSILKSEVKLYYIF